MPKLFLALMIVTCAACSSKNLSDPHHPEDRNVFDSIINSDHYGKSFEDHTIERRVLSEFEPTLTAYATFWNKTLAQDYVDERAREFRLPNDEKLALEKEQQDEQAKFFVFIVSMATKEYEWNDLEKQNSIWRVTLEDPQYTKQISPERIEAISQHDEIAHYFYKHMGSFTRTYRIRFLRDAFAGNKEIVLHLAGPHGSVAFSFHNDTLKNAL